MYVKDGKALPVNLTINYPTGWNILSAAGKPGQNSFVLPNYDLLIDHPVMLGKFFLTSFQDRKNIYYVAIAGDIDKKYIPSFVERIKQVQATAEKIFPPIETNSYVDFFLFPPFAGQWSDGLEHLDSFLIYLNQAL